VEIRNQGRFKAPDLLVRGCANRAVAVSKVTTSDRLNVCIGSISATELRDRRGGTCFDTGRQRGQLLTCVGLSQLSTVGRVTLATGVPQ